MQNTSIPAAIAKILTVLAVSASLLAMGGCSHNSSVPKANADDQAVSVSAAGEPKKTQIDFGSYVSNSMEAIEFRLDAAVYGIQQSEVFRDGKII